jgi:hypothetical protein
MTTSINPAAPHALPSFITAPGETDTFLVVMAIFLVVAVLAVGLLFLRLHTLPERMAHRSQKLQFEIVAVLGLTRPVHAHPPVLGGGSYPRAHRPTGLWHAAATDRGLR